MKLISFVVTRFGDGRRVFLREVSIDAAEELGARWLGVSVASVYAAEDLEGDDAEGRAELAAWRSAQRSRHDRRKRSSGAEA